MLPITSWFSFVFFTSGLVFLIKRMHSMTCWIFFFPLQRKQQQIERERLRRVRPPRSPTTVCYFWKPIFVCNNVLLLRAHRLQFSPNFQHHLQGFQSQIFLGWIDLPEWGSLMSLPARNTKHPTKCRSFRSLVGHQGSSLVLWGTKECVSMHHCGSPAIFGPLRVLAEKIFSDIMDWIWVCEEQGGVRCIIMVLLLLFFQWDFWAAQRTICREEYLRHHGFVRDEEEF